jgi:hypothetical protein
MNFVNKIVIIYPIRAKFGVRVCEHNAVQCEFRENRSYKGRTFLMGVNEITFLCLFEPRVFRK